MQLRRKEMINLTRADTLRGIDEMDWARCTLRNEAEEYTLIVDVLLQGQTVVSGMRYYGEFRMPVNDCFPVIFMEENNLVDNGPAVEDEARYERMKLHGQPMHEGATFAYRWNDQPDTEMTVVSCLKLARSQEGGKGGRPPSAEKWENLWIALIGIAKKGDLERSVQRTQGELIGRLRNEYQVQLSEESLKPKVSLVWNRLGIALEDL